MSVPRPLIIFESENVSCRFDRINRATREFRSHQVVQNLSKFWILYGCITFCVRRWLEDRTNFAFASHVTVERCLDARKKQVNEQRNRFRQRTRPIPYQVQVYPVNIVFSVLEEMCST